MAQAVGFLFLPSHGASRRGSRRRAGMARTTKLQLGKSDMLAASRLHV